MTSLQNRLKNIILHRNVKTLSEKENFRPNWSNFSCFAISFEADMICVYIHRQGYLVSDQRLDIDDRNKYIHCLSAPVLVVKKSSALAEMDNTIFKCPQVSNMHLTV